MWSAWTTRGRRARTPAPEKWIDGWMDALHGWVGVWWVGGWQSGSSGSRLGPAGRRGAAASRMRRGWGRTRGLPALLLTCDSLAACQQCAHLGLLTAAAAWGCGASAAAPSGQL